MKAVDEFAAMGGVNISFNCCIGEPLLDPHLLERARYVKQFPQIKPVWFTTTLQWLHKFNMDEFFNSGIGWLVISTMFLGRERYKSFFRVDCYEQTLNNIIALIKENEKRQTKIHLNFSLKSTGESNKEIMDHPDFKMIDTLMGGKVRQGLDNSSLFVDDWCGAVTLPKYLRKRPIYPRFFRPCRLLYRALHIFSDGKVGLCSCRDFEENSDLIVGDIKKDSLKDLWNGPKHARLVNDWCRKNVISVICRTCRHYVY